MKLKFDNLNSGDHFTDKSGRKFIKVNPPKGWHNVPGEMFYYDDYFHKKLVNALDYAGIPVQVPFDADVERIEPIDMYPTTLDNVKGCDIIIPDFGKHQNQDITNTDKIMKLEEAIVSAITELKPRGSFSAFDVTTQIRDAANNGAIDLPGLEARPNQHNIKYWINHQDVRALIDEMLNNGELNNLGLTDVRFNGTFREFVFDVNAPSTSPAPTTATVPAVQTTGTASQPTVASTAVATRVDNYLKRNLYNNPTLKMVQSAVKVNGITCEQFATIVTNLGYTVNDDGSGNASTFTVS